MLLVLFLGLNLTAFSQGAPPPPPAEGHGQTGNLPAGGGAPLGSGLAMLLVLGVAYAGKRAYDNKTAEKKA